MEKAYTVKEVSKIIGVPERTLRKRIEEGQLQSCQSKNNPRAPHYILETFLAEFIANYPNLPEVKKFRFEQAKETVAKLHEARAEYNEKKHSAKNDEK